METLKYRTETKAIKDHKCNWCLFPIEKGSVYQKSSHKDEGEIYTWKNHVHCSQVLTKIGAWDDGSGIDSESFRECISNEWSKINKSEDYPKFSERLNFVLNFHELNKP